MSDSRGKPTHRRRLLRLLLLPVLVKAQHYGHYPRTLPHESLLRRENRINLGLSAKFTPHAVGDVKIASVIPVVPASYVVAYYLLVKDNFGDAIKE